ncbi:MAG: aminotransferase class V-fold PLP-dependent enzyme [Planctomycetota bacterium]
MDDTPAPRRLYLDNAATSFPKPPGVLQAMRRYATELGASPGRGGYAEAQETGRLFDQCRSRINTLIGGENANHVVFTLNASDALNLAIKGVVFHALASGRKHVVTTHADHNSVLRPFNELVEHHGLQQTRVPCDASGYVDPADIAAAIRPETCLVAVVHGSNVTGAMQPVAQIGSICREHAVPLLVDAAQTLGHAPLDVQRDGIDLLAAPGHKGLLGPLGTGFLYIRPGLERQMRTLREGGTGSRSDLDTQPTFLPDRFEPGSQNAIGIVGLSEGVAYVLDRGVDALWDHQQQLIRQMLDGLAGGWAGHVDPAIAMPGLTAFGPKGVANRCGVFSFRIDGLEPAEVSNRLETEYGILSRSGVHCAPLAHEALGTRWIGGTTRLSAGPFTTLQDVKYAADAVSQLCEDAARNADKTQGVTA